MRTLPTATGRNPDGKTFPSWLTNMIPLPSRIPKPRPTDVRAISSSVIPSASIARIATRR